MIKGYFKSIPFIYDISFPLLKSFIYELLRGIGGNVIKFNKFFKETIKNP